MEKSEDGEKRKRKRDENNMEDGSRANLSAKSNESSTNG